MVSRDHRGFGRRMALFAALAWLVSGGASLAGAKDGVPPPLPAAVTAAARSRPLAFEANRGQTDDRVSFLARGAGYTAFLTSTDAVLALGRGVGPRTVIRVAPVGASPARIVPEAALPGVVNYARHDVRDSAITAPTYARVRYVDVYPGIDLVYYGGPQQLEYDFVLAAGADADRIAVRFDGVERVEVSAEGDLVLHTAAGALRQPRPVVYQTIGDVREPVSAEYRVDADGIVRFALGAYDHARAVVIDPVLAWATYLGGSREEIDLTYGEVFGIALDGAGNVYVTGTTGSPDFPTTPGANGTLSGTEDVFVAKFSPTGALVYSTLLGGPCDDVAYAIAVDAAGNAYVTGRANAGVCLYYIEPGVLVAKLDPTGALVYSLVFGGQFADVSRGHAIAVDGGGNAYVTGKTSAPDFPTTPGSFRPDPCGAVFSWESDDAFVTKVNPAGTGFVYSTFLCGSAHDIANAIAIDAAGNAYVAGLTASFDFPTVNPLQPAPAAPGITTGFVSKLSADGAHLIYSTFLGGSGRDEIRGIAVDAQGNAYVTGGTDSSDYPTTAGVVQPGPGERLLCGPCTDAFVTKINATGSAIVYSTYLFGESTDVGRGIAVDPEGNAYVAGYTDSQYFPIVDAFQPGLGGLYDAFITKLNPDGTRLVYSSYLGGTHSGTSKIVGWDGAEAIAVDAAGNAHLVGYTQSDDFPVTPGAFQPTIGAGLCDIFGTFCRDAFVAKITAAGPGVVTREFLVVTPVEHVPGGTVTVTWAGLVAPTTDDMIGLYALGGLAGPGDEFVAVLTGGTANGTRALTLPAGLPFGWYEVRLLSPDPNFVNILRVVARSQVIHVAPAAADLVVANVTTTPAQPATGQAITVTVNVTNQGNVAAGAFVVDFYKDRAAAPGAGVTGDLRCTIAGLAAGASTQCTGTVTYATAGTFSEWAQVDTGQAVAESNETNNVAGPRTVTVIAPAGPDLVVAALGNPPAGAMPGKTFSVSDTVKNQGDITAGQSTTRYYLSLDGAKGAGDLLLTGARTVAALAAGAQSAGTVTVTIPVAAVPGTYQLLACADDLQVVTETSEVNNCRSAAGTIVVGYPDLVETALTNPPAAARPGTTFSVTDAVRNQGVVTAGASTTRYYLSADAQKGTGDRLLTGSHAAVALAPGATSTKTVTVTIPTTTPPGTYTLLACADDLDVVVEGDERNNCRASATTLTVALPDLVEQTVSVPAAPIRRGTAFTVSDTVVNQSVVATPRSTTTYYYLSLDGVKSTGDTRLTGSRTVPILNAAATSTGSASVTIPSTMVPGTYFVIACADAGRALVESNETNNCRASMTGLVVTP